MEKFWQIILDNKIFRFIYLLAAGSYWYFIKPFADIKFFSDLGMDVKVAEYLATAAVGVPVFILLWIFRTRDVRQQIDKAQMQIYQSHFDSGFENLTGNTRLKVEVGVHSLIKLSEITKEFDGLIKIAFIERIKHYPFSENPSIEEIRYTYLTYGQYILTWLFRKIKETSIPKGANLSYQDLSSMDFKYGTFVGVTLKIVSFQNADLTHAKFNHADLTSVDFSHANLTNVDFGNINLTNVNFNAADLTGTNFEKAKIESANFIDAYNIDKAIFTDEQHEYIREQKRQQKSEN